MAAILGACLLSSCGHLKAEVAVLYLNPNKNGGAIMCRTIAEFLLHDLEHTCRLDEIIEETLRRMPMPESVERRTERSRECPDVSS